MSDQSMRNLKKRDRLMGEIRSLVTQLPSLKLTHREYLARLKRRVWDHPDYNKLPQYMRQQLSHSAWEVYSALQQQWRNQGVTAFGYWIPEYGWVSGNSNLVALNEDVTLAYQ